MSRLTFYFPSFVHENMNLRILNIKLRVILSEPIPMEQCNSFNTVILNVSAIYQQEIVYITSIKSEMLIKCRESKWYGKLGDQHSYLRW